MSGPDVVVDLGFGTAGRDLARATGAVPLGDPGTPLDPDAVPLLAAEAYVWGCPVDWDRLLAGRGRLVRLPAYPWQRRRHWVTTHPRAAERPTPRSASPVDVVEVGVGIETGIGGRGEERSALPAERVITPDPLAIEDLLDVTLDAVAEVLGESGDISPDQGFFELGMDSVMAVNLKDRLESTLAITLPATLTFEFPTPRTLARHLGQFMVAQSPPVPLPVVDGGDASIPPGDMQTLSDDELAERLLSALHSSEDLLSGRG